MVENMTFVFNNYDLAQQVNRRNIEAAVFISDYFFLYLSVIRMKYA